MIYYRATAFQEDVTVTSEMMNPDGMWSEEVTLDDMGKGLYRFEVNFTQVGTWVGLFSEYGVRKLSQNFFVCREKIRPSGRNILNV
jgi:hypothetical protein